MYQRRQQLFEAIQASRENPESLSEEQAAIVAEFWAHRQEIVERRQSREDPEVSSSGSDGVSCPERALRGKPSPPEACIRIPPEATAFLKEVFLGALPLEPLCACASLLGAVALAPLRATCCGYHRAFHSGNFVPVWRAENRRLRREDWKSWADSEDLECLSDRSDLDDEDDFRSSLDFESEFEKLSDSSLDDLYLAMRRKAREDEAEHRARLYHHFTECFIHHDGADEMRKLVKRCWLSPEIAGCIYPDHVFNPPSQSFFPRPLHVAVLANDLPVAKMLLRFARLANCDMEALLYNCHDPSTNFSVMSPVFLALLTLSNSSWVLWSELLVGAGARFNKRDSCIAGNVVAHDKITDAELARFDGRVSRVLTLSGIPPDRLEAELRSFEDTGFDDVLSEAGG